MTRESSNDTPEPIVLLDQADDAYCEERGWVETTVSEDRARDLLTPYCGNPENGETPARPVGLAKRVVLAPGRQPSGDERWFPVEGSIAGAREFYEFDATDTEAVGR